MPGVEGEGVREDIAAVGLGVAALVDLALGWGRLRPRMVTVVGCRWLDHERGLVGRLVRRLLPVVLGLCLWGLLRQGSAQVRIGE